MEKWWKSNKSNTFSRVFTFSIHYLVDSTNTKSKGNTQPCVCFGLTQTKFSLAIVKIKFITWTCDTDVTMATVKYGLRSIEIPDQK